jgi:hypothetical protein
VVNFGMAGRMDTGKWPGTARPRQVLRGSLSYPPSRMANPVTTKALRALRKSIRVMYRAASGCFEMNPEIAWGTGLIFVSSVLCGSLHVGSFSCCSAALGLIGSPNKLQPLRWHEHPARSSLRSGRVAWFRLLRGGQRTAKFDRFGPLRLEPFD